MSLIISRTDAPRRAARLFLAVFFTAVLCQASGWAAQPKLVASSYSDRYHLSTCKIAQNIPAEDLRVFKTPEEAFEANYVPCKKCNPPVPKGAGSREKNNFRRKAADDPDQES